MEAVVLGWDLDRGTRWVPSYEHALAAQRAFGTARTPWTLGTAPAPTAGTAVHLMLQGRTRGLVGHGTVRSSPYLAADPDRAGEMSTHVLVEWDRLVGIGDRIEPDELRAYVPGVAWSQLYGAVSPLSAEEAGALDRAWITQRRPLGKVPASLVGGASHVLERLLRRAHLVASR